ncbi:MAG TPA: MarR family transcriptional regulator [Candidatus Sulfotelmatobacter sp.]|nr:MarR family transcriptional regulator [Candidatus Sulfotelmatobacter sp.]
MENLLPDAALYCYSGHLLAVLKYAQGVSKAALERELDELGLTGQQFLAMALIAMNADISAAELARASFVTPQAMSATVARLEARGLIRRVPCPTGGRTLETRLTPAGEDLLARAETRAAAIENYLRDELGPEQFDTLMSALQRCSVALASAATETVTHRPWAAHSSTSSDE